MVNDEKTEQHDNDEPREDFNADGHDDNGPAGNPEETAAFWCRIAQRALKQQEKLRASTEAAVAEAEHAAECADDYRAERDTARAEADRLEERLTEKTEALQLLRNELAELRAIAREAKNGKTELERQLQASVLLNMLLGGAA